MDKCTKYINLFLFSLFQSCTQHFYHGRQYGNHNNGHNQQFEVLLYKRKVTEEITRITEDGNPAGAPNQVVQHDMNTSALGDPIGLLSGINEIYLPCDKKMMDTLKKCLDEKQRKYKVGTIATGDMFMHDKHQKDKLHERFNAIAAEMEGGSIGHVCYVNKVPFAILRTISDGEGGAMDYATFAEKAAQIGIEIVVEFIQKIA